MFKYIKAYFLGNAILVDFSWLTKNKQKQLKIAIKGGKPTPLGVGWIA